MRQDEKKREHEDDAALVSWRARWAFFALVWTVLVVMLAVLLWPRFEPGPLHEFLLVFGTVAIVPPTLDYVFSWGIAGLLERRARRRR
ncbi:MAG TPA: hypothetical protein VFM34_03450 [Moraxellaceae bacterium]|nr:hypothetical protein [Moraxellaceae bacterium]